MEITFIGDVHGCFNQYNELTSRYPNTIQLGDLGIGFPPEIANEDYIEKYPNHRFIRGNHDNPKECRKLNTYLGDYGYLHGLGIFYVSGAYSIDRIRRTEDIDWWRDEELSESDCEDVIEMYEKIKPAIVISHDCPYDVYPYIGTRAEKRSRTSGLLNIMFALHRPREWIFGHHHKQINFVMDNVRFQAVDILNVHTVFI